MSNCQKGMGQGADIVVSLAKTDTQAAAHRDSDTEALLSYIFNKHQSQDEQRMNELSGDSGNCRDVDIYSTLAATLTTSDLFPLLF